LRIDPLTQVANRHFFDFQLSKKIEETKVFSNTFGILMIDIDHFKLVNDTHGHLTGDEILKIVAISLSSSVEKTDLVSRWGGEEFIVIVDVSNQTELFKIAERLRHVVMSSGYQVENGKSISVTVSIGGTLIRNDDTMSTLIARADELMYEAKRNGRNQSKIL
ncbi:MAG: GGDEF domain-containing protein, partial [Candidatus Izemoplasmatales bacterium]|nr:GGDEF domain-containing protein [Candidatus Izemoplasmatales bacterium]